MRRSLKSLNAQLVTFDTALPFSEVVSRMDTEVNRASSDKLFPIMASATSKEELENGINNISGGKDFVFFSKLQHSRWMNLYQECPSAIVYIIGNPVIAQTMLKHDMRGAFNIPPRVLILEKPDKTGTTVIYHLPSSVMVLDDNPALKAAAEVLDEKLDRLISTVTAD